MLYRLSFLALGMLFFAVIGEWIWGYWGALAGAIGFSTLVFSLHIRSGLKVITWLRDFRLENVPMVSGWWDNLVAHLFRSLKQQVREKDSLLLALESFKTGAQALPDGVVSLDANGCIVWSNETAQRFLGLKLSSDIGQPLINIVRNPEFNTYIESNTWERPLKMRSPRLRAKTLSVQAVGYGKNQMLVLVRDITTLERTESVRRDFIANVSHELKTPLTVLTGFLETFRSVPLDEEHKNEYLSLMHDQASRMQDLVEDLLALSSLESGQSAHEETPVNLNLLAQQSFADAKQLSAGRHKIRLSTVDHTFFASGSEQELQSAFSNIVTNAVRYTPECGKIHLELVSELDDLDHEVVRFSVKDSGIGVAREHIPRLTERFYRVDSSRSRESGGTGLGLAIVKHVMSRHDGSLLIESTPGEGSIFSIQIPLAKAEPIARSNTASL